MRHKTSIIILSYNTLEMLQLCIESIREHTETGSYEIIVVENASKDGSAEWLKEQEDLRCIYNEENQGFPKGCNQGLEIAEGTELLLLNSDTIVTKNWLENLCRALYSAPAVGAVSCVTNCCSNNQQIEAPYENIAEMQAFAADYNKSNPARWEKKTTLVGFCFLFKRDVFDKVGFLDEQFSPGNFEDDDYSLRILQQGWDLLLCRDTFIHHFGHASFLKGYGAQEAAEKVQRSNALLQRNGALFQQKWHVPPTYKVMAAEELRRLLQPRTPADGAAVERRSSREKKIAVLVRKSREEQYGLCLESLKSVKWPHEYEAELFTIDAAKPYAAQVNEIVAGVDAELRLYINDELCFVCAQAIEELLALFQDEGVGMVGVLGSRSLPVSGDLMDSPYKCGAVYVPLEKDLSELRFGETSEEVEVRFLLPSLFATRRDIPWDEAYDKQYYAVLAHCLAMEDCGLRIVVPGQQEIWCAYQEKNIVFDTDEADRKVFFSRHHPYLAGTEPQGMSALYACGAESVIPSWQKFGRPEGIRIGEGTHICETAFLRLAMANFMGRPRIVIGDHVKIDAGSTVTAAQRVEIDAGVSIAENVHIKDCRLDDSGLGLSPADREIVAEGSGVRIERGACLEENVIVKGSVCIGRGSIVRAGSMVCADIPAYCIAEGSPAHVTAAFSPKTGKWLPVAGGKALKKLLAEREKTPPLLTVAFITYNRSIYLKRSLTCVLRQIGNDDLTEIIVSDNVSTDDTRVFVEEMQKTYGNLRYCCNEENVGAEENIHRAIQKSRGEYVLVSGDDDYFADGSLHALLTNIVRHRGVALFYLGNAKVPRCVYRGEGCLQYIGFVSYYMAWITSVVMRRDLYAHIPEPHRYDASGIPQIYLQLEMLKQKPDFAVLHGVFFADDCGDRRPRDYNLAEVFIKNYFDILTATVKIPAAQLAAEKKRVMEESILPWCQRIKKDHVDLSLEGLFDIVAAYYGKEPYYAQLVDLLKGIVQG